MSEEKSRLAAWGCLVSDRVANLSAHPYSQIAVVAVCLSWFAFGLGTNALTAGLSIMAITLTQMVLNQQQERESIASRRDIALHAKLDELIIASKAARNEMAGVEEREVEEIEELKEELKEEIKEAVVVSLPVEKRARKRRKS